MKKSYNPKLSIITTTWDRQDLLKDLFLSLKQQENSSFEWIICDDCSTDNTKEVVRTFKASNPPFEIRYFHADRRIGKIVLDNVAIREARGDFIIWCDSDDYFKDDAFERILGYYNKIKLTTEDEICGVISLCKDNIKHNQPSFPSTCSHSETFLDLFYSHNFSGDFCMMIESKEIKKYQFPEVDTVIPEDILFLDIKKKFALLNEKTKLVRYFSHNHVSFTGMYDFPRGRFYRLATIKKILKDRLTKKPRKFSDIISFYRFAIHGEVNFNEAHAMWPFKFNIILHFLFFSVSYLICKIDQIRGNVNKTHRLFMQSKDRVNIRLIN